MHGIRHSIAEGQEKRNRKSQRLLHGARYLLRLCAKIDVLKLVDCCYRSGTDDKVSHGYPTRVTRGQNILRGPELPDNSKTISTNLMNQDEPVLDKSMQGGLSANDDARRLVRLIQCRQCSKPLRIPVTLPCGNSLCRQCLPEAHERVHISWPDLPSRRQGIQCPFPDCNEAHPVSDCSVDVTVSKLMEQITEIITRHTSTSNNAALTEAEVVRWESILNSPEMVEKPRSLASPAGRLIITFALASRGSLGYEDDLEYAVDELTREDERALDINVLQDILDATQREVDCQVCYNLMLDPVTTFCGHTLCKRCMARVLDHSQHCPVCRRELALPPSILGQPTNKTLINLLNGLCPDAVQARRDVVLTEERGVDGDLNVPLFVCTLGFPEQPTFLRIFEPRYRLMLRRSLESNGQFGMLMYNRYREPQPNLGPVHFYQIGTMLRIVNSQLLPDGTSLIETRGSYRFKVTAHGVLDGYSIGNVERIEDVPLAEEERIEAEEVTEEPLQNGGEATSQINRMSTRDLLSVGQEFVTRMQQRSANWLQQRVLDIHGQPPADAALFPYWFASVLPISEEEKYKLLDTRTVRERLKITAMWIRRIQSQRW